jgi:hypothetical protein
MKDGDPDVKVKSTSRRMRKVCQTKCKDDPTHICSRDHVRVPAHCRLKRNKKKKTGKSKSALTVPVDVQKHPDPSLLLLPAQFDGNQMWKTSGL